ncbi:MAG: amino acid adenylation domain-containing protein [Candidatus Omnitrophota bacterium]
MDQAAEQKYVQTLKKASAKIKELLAENDSLKKKEPIAVIGVGCRFPGDANSPEAFWNLLINGVDAVAEIPPDRWDVDAYYDPNGDAPGKMYTRCGAFLKNADRFDAAFFGITPREAEAIDPQQRILLEVSWETLENAGVNIAKLRGSRTGVFLGLSNYDYIQAHIHSGDAARITPYSGSGVMFSTAAGRLSYTYDFRGPCLTVDTACSSSLVSLHLAIQSLWSGESDLALTGGVNLLLSLDSFIALAKVNALSRDGRCRTFDNAASGYGRGEGCGLILLKRLSEAQRDGDRLLAVIRGAAVNHDGRSNGLTAPNGPAQREAIRKALDAADLSPNDVDYIEAHGTGTILGDPIEVNALSEVFRKGRPPEKKLLIGSVKTNIGHTEASAGIAGVIKVILSLQHKKIPASLHYHTPNQHIPWNETPIKVVSEAMDWIKTDAPRVAGVSSFGLSGTNAHVLIEEAPEFSPAANVKAERPLHILPLSAQNDIALQELGERYRQFLSEDGSPLADLCHTVINRAHFTQRLALIGASKEEMAQALEAYGKGEAAPNLIQSREKSELGAKGIAFLYTGQGAQYVGMGRVLFQTQAVFREALERCDALLRTQFKPSLIDLLYSEAAEEVEALNQTAITQPALFAIEYALTELWSSWGITPSAVVGHSIGEYAAACAAGVFTLETGLQLAAERGRLMQSLPAGGTMAAVFASEAAVRNAISAYGERISIAAVNGPERITISGDEDAIHAVLDRFKKEQIESRPLRVSHAFHSRRMEPIVKDFAAQAAKMTFSPPQIPFYSTAAGGLIPPKEIASPSYWSQQILQPVLFYNAIQSMVGDGYILFLEIGPMDALTALGRQCAPGDDRLWLPSLRKGVDDWRRMLASLGLLYVHGADIDWEGFDAPYAYRKVVLPNYPFQRKRYWLDLSPIRAEKINAVHCQEATIEEMKDLQAASSAIDNKQISSTSIDDVRKRVLVDLTKILAEIGGFAPQDIQPQDNLMEMGLDSLMLLKMGLEIKNRYGVELQMSQFFQELINLDDLSAHLVQHGAIKEAAAPPPPTPPAFEPLSMPPTPPANVQTIPTTALSGGNALLQLMQQQLQCLSQISAQNAQIVSELLRQPSSILAPPAGEISPLPKASSTPSVASKTEAKKMGKGAEKFRSLNLKKGSAFTPEQRAFIDGVIRRHTERAKTSKTMTSQSRSTLADWKHTLSYWGQFKEAKFPIVSARSHGSRFWDVDGNEYIDIAMGMGVHFFGHTPPFIVDALTRQMAEGMELGTQCDLTGEVARLICELTGMERVTFSNTGTEAVMVALRLARAAARRNKIVLFKNSYHGIFDGVLAEEADGEIAPVGLGTPRGMIEDVIVLEYDAPESLEFIAAHAPEIAAVLVEPAQSRNPDLQPQVFLRRLRRLTREREIALIFDEMITGFRIHPGGAQAWFGVQADIATYGKIVGGGMPIGVIAGKTKYLDYIDGGAWDYGDNSGPRSDMIYFGGTFGRNPMTMASARAALLKLKESGPALQEETTRRTTAFCDALNYWCEKERIPMRAKHFASQWRLVPLSESDHLHPIEMEILYLLLMINGVYTWERRICFFSAAHSEEDIDLVLWSIKESIEEIRAAGFAFEAPEDAPRRFLAPSSTQRRLYALSQRPGGQFPYHLPQSFWIDGPLDVDKLEDCFAQIIRRYESLRARFLVIDGELTQHIADEPRFSVERYEADEDGIGEIEKQFLRPFDLEQAPLLRVGVVKIRPDRYLLMADAHHIAVDGISFNIIARDLMALYQGLSLTPIKHSYRECLRLIEEEQKSQKIAKQEAFWREQLGGTLPALNLPSDYPRPAELSFEGDHLLALVDAPLLRRLKTLAKQSGASLYMLLLAAYNVLLYRLTGQDDILVGGPASGRQRAELAEAVGMFVNTVVLRCHPRGDAPFREFLDSVKNTCAAVYDNQDYPFEKLAEWNASRSQSRHALFDAMLSYENADSRVFTIKDLTFMAREIHLPASMFDFSLDIVEESETLHLDFQYSTRLFKRETAERWRGYFLKILQEIAASPDRPIGGMDILTHEERDQLAQWNNTSADYPQNKTLADLFEEQVHQTPDRPAVVFGGAVLAYRELNARANRIANALRQQYGVKPGDLVGVLLERSEWTPVALLGVLKAGGAYVPLDPEYPAERLNFMMEDSGCRVLLTSGTLAQTLAPAVREKAVDIHSFASAETSNPAPAAKPDMPAYVIYTSGSTGKPKGCLITHRNVVRLMKNSRFDFDFHENDVWAIAHSFCFDFSVWEMYGALLYGGKTVVVPKEVARDSHAFLDFIQQNKITVLNQTPGAFYNLIEAERRQKTHNLGEHLRYVIFGGDRLEPAFLRPWTELYPLDKIALINMYGITETTVHVTYYPIRSSDISGAGGRSPIGRPIPETTLYICGEFMNQQPIGVAGEIYVGGTGVCQGCLNRPELTKERFLASPFRKNERLYRTGDLGRRLADGGVEYLGRNDRQVQIRGFRIELEEIGHQLLQHPRIEKAVVLAHEAESGAQELTAYFTAAEPLNIQTLRQHLSQTLPVYMIPSYFVQMETFPLTANGKVDRKALPAPDRRTINTGTAYAAPRNPIEAKLAQAWKEVLGASSVGIYDDYFALGGDSIKAIQVVSRLYQVGLKVEMSQLFQARTIAVLAGQAKEITRAANQSAAVGEARLTPIQRWFFKEHFSDRHHFNHAALWRAQEQLDEAALRQALAAIQEHHDALRMRYRFQRDDIIQEVNGLSHPLHFETADLRQNKDGAAALTARAEEMQKSFNLETGPLMKAALFRLEDGDRLLLLFHHLVIDGVSWRILMEDLESAYRQAQEGKTIHLPAKTSSFIQWGDALDVYAGSDSLLAGKSYWREIESTAWDAIPRDFDAADNLYRDEDVLHAELTAQETEDLLKRASHAYRTEINDLLLTALSRALKNWSGGGRFRLLLEGHGRESVAEGIDASRTVGWFTSLYPAILDISGANDLPLQIKTIKETLRRIPKKGVGYGILKYLTLAELKEDLAFGLAPEIAFNYLGSFDAGPNRLFSLAKESTSHSCGDQVERAHLLEIEGAVFDGRLQLAIHYNRRIHRQETIQHFLDNYQNELRRVIDYCRDRIHDEITPSDLHYCELNLDEFDSLLRSIGAAAHEVEDILPLSTMQEGMLYHSLAEENSNSYFEQFAYRLRGDLDRGLFESAWNELVRRHAILRVSFVYKQVKRPLQIVWKKRDAEFHYQDLRHLPAAEREARVEYYCQEDRRRPFDLTRCVLMRIALLQIEDKTFEVVWSHHHIILDGWSLGVLQEDFASIYQALRTKQPLALAPAPSYGDYIDWLEQRDKDAARRFWDAYLEGYDALAVPLGRIAGTFAEYALEERPFSLSKETCAGLNALAARLGATLNSVIQTLWGILLGRYSGKRDVVFGAVVSGRPAEVNGVENMVGLFLHSLPVRIRIDDHQTFAELAQNVQRRAAECEPHHYYPLVEIQTRSPLKHDLLNHLLVFENFPLAQKLQDGSAHSSLGFIVENVRGVEQMHYDFGIVIHPGEETEIKFTYNANAYDRRQIENMENHFRSLVAAVLQNENILFDEIEILSEREKLSADDISTPSAASYRADATVLDLFEEQARRTPDAIAADGAGKEISYRELNRRANILARALRERGVQRGVLVGVYQRNSINYLVSILAAQKAGGVFVPLDVDSPIKRLETILNKIEPAILITSEAWKSSLDTALSAIQLQSPPQGIFIAGEDGAFDYERWGENSRAAVTSGKADENLEDRPVPGDSLYVIFTSGSTGEPKAILSSHEGLSHFIQWEISEFGFDASVRASNLALTTFDVSLRDIFVPLLSGGIVCIPDHELRGNASLLLRWLDEKQVSLMHIVPSIFRMLLNEIEARGERKKILSAMRFVILAGEALLGKDVLRGRECLGDQTQFVNLYGPSETTLAKIFNRLDGPIGDPNKIIPIGKPIQGANVFILKEKKTAAAGAIGEICIQPPFRCQGYFRDPAMTVERFVHNPLSDNPDDIIYRTGDLGRFLPDGAIDFIGRVDRQVKINGVRVELAEIDRAVLASPEIDQTLAAVHKRADGQEALACYYTEKTPIDGAVLRERLRDYLPPAMIPSFFVRMDAFPLNVNGKIDRRALPKPEELIYDRIAYEPPAGETEEKLAAIWRETLGLERVGVNSPFLEIGGNSLNAIRILSWIHRDFGVDVSIRLFFERSTIRQLAEYIRTAQKRDYAAIEPLPPRPDYAVSHAQRRLWILSQLEVASEAYSLPTALLLEGSFNVIALRKALETIVKRHESLRTTFASIAGEPRQIIHDDIGFQVELIDVSGESQSEEKAKKLARQDAVQRFDLTRGPLLRAKLVKLGEHRHILLVNIHHIVFDGWSASVIVNELLTLYQAFAKNEENPLAPLKIHYKDYAAWQNALLTSEAIQPHREYWRQQFTPEPPPLNLPTDRPRPAIQTFNGDKVVCAWDKDFASMLRRFAREHGGSLFMTLTALVKTLFYRYSGQEDIIIGSPIAGRDHADLENQIGFYVNTLALRDRLKGSDSFAQTFEKIKRTAEEALEHRAYPFDRLVDDLGLERDMSRPPLFEVMLILQDKNQREFELEGVKIGDFIDVFQVSKFAISFEFVEKNNGEMLLNLEYNTDLFDRGRMERMAQHLAELAKNAVADPSQSINKINILPEWERRQVLTEFNDCIAPYPQEKTIAAQFEEIAAAAPDRLAVICEEAQLTYAELNERANKLAHRLREDYGIGPDKLAAVLLDRSEWTPIVFLGIVKAGGAYLPIDPSYPRDRIDYMLSDSQCSVVLTDEKHRKMFGETLKNAADICALQDGSPANPISAAKADNLAYVIYTSGSTGRPKGVMLEHSGALNLAAWHKSGLGVTAQDRVLQFAPSSFDASVWEMLMALLQGACLVVAGRERVDDYRRFADYINEKQVTIATLPPSYAAELKAEDLPSLRLLVSAGEAARVDDALAFAQCLRFVNAYGPTESTVCATAHEVDALRIYNGAIPIGKPISNFEILILDEYKNPAPIGVPGEIGIGGAGLARGYLRRDDLTASAFISHPFKPGRRLYLTGDLGYWLPGGEVVYMGRRDDQVKVRGFRIECGEIEHHLLQHPKINGAAVVVRDAADGAKELIGYIAASEVLDAAALKDYLAKTLPDYMIPTRWAQLDAMPLSPSGKVDRKALPAPEAFALGSKTEYAAPRNETEAVMAKIWQDVLGRKTVGIHERFFEIGGDSIKAIQTVSRLRQAGVALEMKDLFQSPTIAALAGKTRAAKKEVMQEAAAGAVALTPIQHWFFEERRKDLHHFNHSALLKAKDRFDESALKLALEALQNHHDALRMRFHIQHDKIVQEYAPLPVPLSFETIDMRKAKDGKRDFLACAETMQRSLNLEKGPLMKTALCRLKDGDRLLIVIHHLVVDIVSWGVLFEDLATAYRQTLAGREIRLPMKTDSFKQWSEALRKFSETPSLLRELDYWTKTAAAETAPIPVDFPISVNRYGDSETVGLTLSSAATNDWLAKTNHAFKTETSDLLLTALARALKRWHGGNRCLIMLEGHGRETAVPGVDVSHTAGWFTSLYPVVLELRGKNDIGGQIKEIKETLRRIPNKGIGYGALRYLTPPERLGGASLLIHGEIGFNYLGRIDEKQKDGTFALSQEPCGSVAGKNLERSHLLDVGCMIQNDRLEITILFNRAIHRRQTIEQFLEHYAAELNEIVAYCQSRQTAEITPSDVSRVKMDLNEFEDIFQDE